MARTKTFDEALTLDRAMALFWQQGFEATSMRDLMAGAGISSSSLYATFGDKRDVYLAALERYRAQERAEFAAALAEARPLRLLLAELFATMIATLLAGRIAAAQATGEIANPTPAIDLARHLLVGFYSLATVTKIFPDQAFLESEAALTLAVVS